MNYYQHLDPAGAPKGVPALFTILSDPILDEEEIRIVERHHRRLKVKAMLISIDPTLLGTPFESHRSFEV
jgi:hypothetical protein